MVFNSSWKPLFHIEVTAAEEDGGKEEGKRLRGGGGDWTILDDYLMKNRWGRHYCLQVGPDPYAAPDGGWGWVVMIARSRKTSTTKINILNFFLTPQISSPSLQTMFPHRLHIRQKQIFCSFICNLTLDGIAYTFGVFLVPLMEYFELKEKGPISMIGNNNYTMEMFTCNTTIQISI